MKALKDGLNIITNNIPRDIIYGYQLPKKFRKEYDFMDEEEIDNSPFFKYRDWYFYIGDFMRISNDTDLKGWDGYMSETFFSGIVVKYTEDFDQIIVGTYFSK